MAEATKQRVILHCDCNNFYASVELLERPELRDLPVAVAGSKDQRHGIILAKNMPAKRRGVVTAETIASAQRKCPGLILLPPHHRRYAQVSRQVSAIYARYTDLIEPFGIDESWLDVTGSLHLFAASGQELADQLRAVIKRELGLTISVGVSFNKIFAKLGSDLHKPDATTVISAEDFERIVFPLPVADLLFVGPATEKTLHELGIRTIGQLAKADCARLLARLGKSGEMLWLYANGLDTAPVTPAEQGREVQSIGNSMTFRRDLQGWEDIRSGVAVLADSVGARLRKQGYKCQQVQVGIKNPLLQTIQRQRQLAKPTYLAREIATAALAIIADSWQVEQPIRLLSITGGKLLPLAEEQEQLALFAEEEQAARQKQERLEKTLDQIRGKYGPAAIYPGALTREDLGFDPADELKE